MTTSVIIPAYRAQDCLLRAVSSLRAQTVADWQAVIVSDDGVDYRAVLDAAGAVDDRMVFVSTDRIGSGCHHARNIGLGAITGDSVSWLDADDEWLPQRLETLLPLARQHGAAADVLLCVDEQTGQPLPQPDLSDHGVQQLDLAAFMQLDQPLVPLFLREHVQERIAGAEMAEDVLANIRLIDRIGRLPLIPQRLYRYYIRTASLAHAAQAEDRFDSAYAEYMARLAHGDGFGLKPASRITALAGFGRKRALNQAYAEARRTNPALTFEDFARTS